MSELFDKKIFPAVVFLILLLPLIFVNRKEGAVSEAENRALASPARLYLEDGSRNPEYTSDVETWFNDNMGFRDAYVNVNGAIRYYLFRQIPGIPLSREGALIPYETLEDYQHSDLLEADELEQVADSYQLVYEYLHSQGIPVYYMQCWDKHTIYPEQYTQPIPVLSPTSLADQVEQALTEKTDLTVIPIKDRLLEAKEQYTLYGTWSDPWHWLQRGAFIAYGELMSAINAAQNDRYRVFTEQDFLIEKRDVGKTYSGGIHVADVQDVFALPVPHAVSVREKLTYMPAAGMLEHAEYYENYASDNEDTLLILGDSYIHDAYMMHILAESFRTTVMFNGSSLCEDNLLPIITTYQPDLVIIENAERCNYRFEEILEVADQLRTRKAERGQVLGFGTVSDTARPYVISGVSKSEDTYAWSEGTVTEMFLYMPEEEQSSAHGTLELGDVMEGSQTVRVLVNRQEVYCGQIVNGQNVEFDLEIPASGMVSLRIEVPDAISPFHAGASVDARTLGLQLRSLVIR